MDTAKPKAAVFVGCGYALDGFLLHGYDAFVRGKKVRTVAETIRQMPHIFTYAVRLKRWVQKAITIKVRGQIVVFKPSALSLFCKKNKNRNDSGVFPKRQDH